MEESILTPKGMLYCHCRMIERLGGEHGVKDVGALKAALVRPSRQVQGKDLFPTPFSKAAVLMHALLTTAPFQVGNRRTAVAAALLVLAEQGYECGDLAPEDVKTLVNGVLQGQVSFGDLADWLEVNSRPNKRAQGALAGEA